MGSTKSKNLKVDNEQLQRMYPEPDYIVKTSTPVSCKDFKTNIKRAIREDEFKDESMVLARRKCFDPAMVYGKCIKEQGRFWMVFNCQEEYNELSECLEHEYEVEMDKRRRNMTRNPEPWWQEYYNQHGQIGKQAELSGFKQKQPKINKVPQTAAVNPVPSQQTQK